MFRCCDTRAAHSHRACKNTRRGFPLNASSAGVCGVNLRRLFT
jgi:hypothetical protein